MADGYCGEGGPIYSRKSAIPTCAVVCEHAGIVLNWLEDSNVDGGYHAFKRLSEVRYEPSSEVDVGLGHTWSGRYVRLKAVLKLDKLLYEESSQRCHDRSNCA